MPSDISLRVQLILPKQYWIVFRWSVMFKTILKSSIMVSALLYAGLAIIGCVENKSKDLRLMTNKQADKNAITQEPSMWEAFTESRTVHYSPKVSSTFELMGIKREDGFTVIAEKMTHEEKIQTFVCKGNFGEFRFDACRWKYLENKPSERYVVYTKSFSKNWNQEPKTNENLILTYAKDIEAALLHFPNSHSFNNIAVKEVLFDLSSATEQSHKLVHAVEIIPGKSSSITN